MSVSLMSDYERRAYDRLTEPSRDSRSLVPRRMRSVAVRAGQSVRDAVAKIPGNEAVAEAYAKAAKGLMDVTTGHGIHSVNLNGSIKRHQKHGHEIDQASDFLKLDLRQCDELIPGRQKLHSIVAAAEGAASSLLITGATVSTTVSGGATAAIALGTVAADSVIVMAGLGRIVGEVAVAYGYDPNLPEEELFAVQVLGLGMAVGSGAKATALASLSRLTQQMMRQPTWAQLSEHVLVGVINQAFASMGLKLTQKKLGQVVPIAGLAISAGVNVQLVQRVHAAAMKAYRLRFLTEKYQLNASSQTLIVKESEGNGQEQVVQVDALLDDAVQAEHETPGADGAGNPPTA